MEPPDSPPQELPTEAQSDPPDEFLYRDPILATPVRPSTRTAKPRDFWDPAVSIDFTSFVDHVMDRPDYEQVKDSIRFASNTEFAHAVSAASETYPTGAIPTPFLPEPMHIKSIGKLIPQVRAAWSSAFESELMNLVGKKTFAHPTDYNGEQCLPIRAVLKTKLRSDGMVDKLKVRITIRGDLDKGAIDEDNSAPLASFRLLKVFLSKAARQKRHVYQANYVGAYLQAKMDR